jgi:hypothetical protein
MGEKKKKRKRADDNEEELDDELKSTPVKYGLQPGHATKIAIRKYLNLSLSLNPNANRLVHSPKD